MYWRAKKGSRDVRKTEGERSGAEAVGTAVSEDDEAGWLSARPQRQEERSVVLRARPLLGEKSTAAGLSCWPRAAIAIAAKAIRAVLRRERQVRCITKSLCRLLQSKSKSKCGGVGE